MLMALEQYASHIAAAIGVALGLAAFLSGRIRSHERRLRFYDFVESGLDSALISADRVLKNGATPPEVRKFLLIMLQALATPEVGRDFAEWFAFRAGKEKAKKPGKVSELSLAIDKLHAQNPALAADIHRALMGIVMSLPVLYADKIDILEMVGEGATNPESVFDKAVKAVSKISGRADGGGNGPQFANC